MSRTKGFIFGFIAAVIIPVLFFVLLEQGLKLFGIGKSFDYFTEIEIEGKNYFQDNRAFSEQFYPASLDIIPLENTFSAEPEKDVIRVFILGGSAARGFPNPDHGFSRHLETLLRQALPTRNVEVINTAMTSINSHVVYEIAKAVPATSSDFAIIFMGNNEVVGPYGPGTFNQNFLANLNLIRGLQSVKRLRITQGLSALTETLSQQETEENLQWQGMQMFTEHTVAVSDDRLQTVYDHFQTNLEDIINGLQDKGAHVLLSTVPVNLRDSAPFASENKPGLSEDDRKSWQTALADANANIANKNIQNAISDYQNALAIDPGHADTRFRLAQAYEQAENFTKAAEQFELSRDMDTLRFRADSRINERIRTVAETLEADNLTFVDNESIFYDKSKPGMPGFNLLLEHVHFDFSGNYLLAMNFTHSILEVLKEAPGKPLPSESEIALMTGYPDKETIAVMNRLLDMVQSPPFSGQSNHAELENFISEKTQQITDEVESLSEIEQIERKQFILAQRKGDWRTRFQLAELFEQTRNRAAAYDQLELVFAEYPHHRGAHMMIAKMLHEDRRYKEEIPHLKQALKYTRGDEYLNAMITGWLGVAYYSIGEKHAAFSHLLEVARNNPAQVAVTIQAYETLIAYSRKSSDTKAVIKYANELQEYATNVVSTGKHRDYPQLYTHMAKILRQAGFDPQARAWLNNTVSRQSAR